MSDTEKKASAVAALAKVAVALAIVAAVAYFVYKGLAPAAPGASGTATRPSHIIYTCSMDPQVRQDKPGRCPICGMELIPVEDESAPAAPADTHSGHAGAGTESTASTMQPVAAKVIYTCSMHPQIRQDKPGRCPICGMELVPVEGEPAPSAGSTDTSLRRISFSNEAAALMDVETTPVERKSVQLSVSMPGTIAYNETTLSTISAWVGGRVDKLHIDYTGATVKSGDAVADVYSPDLYASQRELLQAVGAVGALSASTSAIVREAAANTVSAAREKLRLLGMTDSQLEALEKSGAARDHVTIYAKSAGTVVSKDVVEGQYIDAGMKLYTLADLSTVWVEGDAYESDLPWLSVGQTATFETVAYPGEKLAGTITFVAPTVNAMSRTARVRVEAPNPEGKLKPEMLVRATVPVTLDASGKAQRAAARYVCPIHPQVVSDRPGSCPVCGMALVASGGGLPLVIPSSAPLVTGKRAVVYVSLPGQANPTFEGRVVELGPRAGDYYVVLAGLDEGEHVVTRGNFKIDASLQIQAKPSMMSPEGGASSAMAGHDDMAGHSGH